MNKALFLDRDGIINVDHGYVYKIEDFEFVKGIFELCSAAQQKSYKIFVVTNQSGIARGYYTSSDFKILTQWMLEQFTAHHINISQVYFCPHHFYKGINEFKLNCNCRKPAPGMIKQAESEYGLALNESIMLGDKLSDMESAYNAGVGQRIFLSSEQNRENSLITQSVFSPEEVIPFL